MTRVYLEISSLFESAWTGIPIVISELARGALADAAVNWGFLYENIVIDRDVVVEILTRRAGGDYLEYLERQLWADRVVTSDQMRDADCVFTNVKSLRRVFRREALVVYDFSTLLAPEFHNEDTIRHHANRVRNDIGSTDFFFCISNATRTDLQGYFGVASDKIAVIPLGVGLDPCTVYALLEQRKRLSCEPYICVLGTIEPRKNGAIVLDLLAEYPELLRQYKVVFVGRDGWLDQKAVLFDRLHQHGLDTDRVMFTGFVTEEAKLRLLLGCRFCIYPSLFEGFGIPVAEAAALGKFTVCSNSSSLTEVAPAMSFYFDPLDVFSLRRAFERAERASQVTRLDRMAFSDVWGRIKGRSWDKTYDVVRNWIVNPSGAS
jgi:glycosyltransferase involved in cell wall biosynthesis